MKINKDHIIIFAVVVLGVSFLVFSSTLATSRDDIVFPVAELNNCANETECRIYCDKTENILACVNFAEGHNLMSKEEAEIAKKFSAIGKGPGACASQKSCESYCDDINHIDECLAFAEKHGIMPEKELEEAKKVQAALAGGAKLPGDCTNRDACETFCEDPNHMEECIIFAEAAGFMSGQEAEIARKTEENRKVMPDEIPNGIINDAIPDNAPPDKFFGETENTKEQTIQPQKQVPTDDEMMRELDALESEIFEETSETELKEILDEIPIDSLGGLLIKILSNPK